MRVLISRAPSTVSPMSFSFRLLLATTVVSGFIKSDAIKLSSDRAKPATLSVHEWIASAWLLTPSNPKTPHAHPGQHRGRSPNNQTFGHTNRLHNKWNGKLASAHTIPEATVSIPRRRQISDDDADKPDAGAQHELEE